MLFGKKRKIADYLQEKDVNFSIFDLLLKEYLSGALTLNLKKLGLTKIEIHVDWFDDIKILGIQARYKEFCLDIQVDDEELAIGCSKTEPDCDEFFALDGETGTDFVYNKIKRRIGKYLT